MLAVLDFRSGTFLVGVDAEYEFGDKGQLIEIGGSAEAYFSFADPMAWHLYLGRKDPKEKRIRAGSSSSSRPTPTSCSTQQRAHRGVDRVRTSTGASAR